MIERLIVFIVLFTSALPDTFAFECYTCNMETENDQCVDKIETCEPGIESCTMVSYNTEGKNHVRKFCTSPGTPIYQYLLFFPGSALCQNIDTSNDHQHFSENTRAENDLDVGPPGTLVGPPSPRPPATSHDAQTLHRAKRIRRSSGGPPAPPHSFSSSLLCVCSTERCNFGPPNQVLNRLMLNQLPKANQKFNKKHTDDGLQTLRV